MDRKSYDVAPLEGCHPQMGLMAAMLEDGTREWREELGKISPEGIVWQPFPGGHSIGAVLLHIIEVEVFWIEAFCMGMPTTKAEAKELMSAQIKQYSVKWPVPPKRPISYYYGLQDGVRARTLRHIKALTEPQAMKSREKYDVTVRWVLSHVVEHESYHGGQIVLLKELFKRRNA